jgi:hypothetical protein
MVTNSPRASNIKRFMAESIGKGEQQDLSARAAVGLLRKIVRFRTDLESVRLDTIDKVDQLRENSPGTQPGKTARPRLRTGAAGAVFSGF